MLKVRPRGYTWWCFLRQVIRSWCSAGGKWCPWKRCLWLGRSIWLCMGFCSLGKEVFSWECYPCLWEGLWEHAVTAGGTFRAYMLVYDDDEWWAQDWAKAISFLELAWESCPGFLLGATARHYDLEARFMFTGTLRPQGTRVLLGRCSLAHSFVWRGCKPVTALVSPSSPGITLNICIHSFNKYMFMLGFRPRGLLPLVEEDKQ